MKLWRRIGVFALLGVVLILGFSLPAISGYVQDARTDQTRQAVTAARVQLNMGSSLTLLQKLRIAVEPDLPVELDSAQTMDADQALEQLIDGLSELFPEDQDEIPFDKESFSEVRHSVYLTMSGENSLIYWEFWLTDGEGNQITAQVDDDTGLILSLTYILSSADDEEEDGIKMPATPLFLIPENLYESVDIFATDSIFGGFEETGSSIETFLQELQQRYCDEYLLNRGYGVNWETDSTETVENSYLYSVMLVDNIGGYYVLPFSLTNNEIGINNQ